MNMKHQNTSLFTKMVGLAGMIGGLLFGTAQKAGAQTIPIQPVQANSVNFNTGNFSGLGVGAQRDSVFQTNRSAYLSPNFKAHISLDEPQHAPDAAPAQTVRKKAPKGYTATTYHLDADNKRLAAVIKKHELDVSYPYLDVKGNFTVGRGFAAFNVREAQQFPFYLRDKKTGKLTSHLASQQQIADNYKKLKEQKYGKGIYAYTMRHVTNIGLRQSDIEDIYERKMTVVLQKLDHDIKNFEHLPIPGQIALADMSWQTGRIRPYHQVRDSKGHTHYKRAWKTFTAALDQGNLPLAAKHCYRPDAGGVRNRDTRLLLTEAHSAINADRLRLAAEENKEIFAQTADSTTQPHLAAQNKTMFSPPTMTSPAPVFTSQLIDLRRE